MHDEYSRKWARATREMATDPAELEVAGGWSEDAGYFAADLRDAQEAEIRRLRAHLAAGRLSEPDFFLLVGTRVYAGSLADYAREAGLDYQVAKKRRQRAEAALRRYERQSP